MLFASTIVIAVLVFSTNYIKEFNLLNGEWSMTLAIPEENLVGKDVDFSIIGQKLKLPKYTNSLLMHINLSTSPKQIDLCDSVSKVTVAYGIYEVCSETLSLFLVEQTRDGKLEKRPTSFKDRDVDGSIVICKKRKPK